MSFFKIATTAIVTALVTTVGLCVMFTNSEIACSEKLKLDFYGDCEKIAKNPELNKEEIKAKLLSLIETSLEMATVTALLNATVHTLRTEYTDHVNKILYPA